MPEYCDSIVFEIREPGSATWTDVSADVRQNPAPTGNIGIMGNGYTDRIGGDGYFSFSLDNSASNSQATLGYYTSNLVLGSSFRLTMTYDGTPRQKWFGYIESIEITPGVNASRDVKVKCRDWLTLMAEYKLDRLPQVTGVGYGSIVPTLIDTLPLQPGRVQSGVGTTYTFASTFDLLGANTTVIGELSSYTNAEFGYLYMSEGGHLLMYENRLKRSAASASVISKHSSDLTDFLLLEDGTSYLLLEDNTSKLLLEGTQSVSFTDADVLDNGGAKVSFARHYFNYVTAVLTPRKYDAAATTILWTLETPVMVPANSSVKGIRGRYRDPNGAASYINGINMQTQVPNTDFKAYANEDGTGADLTTALYPVADFGTAEVEFELFNLGGTNLYTGGDDILFQVKGMGIYIYDPVTVVIDWQDELGTGTVPYEVGRSVIDLDLKYRADVADVRDILKDNIFDASYTPAISVEAYPLNANRDKKNMLAFMCLNPGSLCNFSETVAGFDKEYFINGYSFTIRDGKNIFWTPILCDLFPNG